MPKGSNENERGSAANDLSFANKNSMADPLAKWDEFFTPLIHQAELKSAIDCSDWKTIWKIYTSMLNNKPLGVDDRDLLLQQAYQFGSNGLYKKGALIYSLLHVSDSCPAFVYRNLAVLLRNLQAWQCALEVIDKYLLFNPNCSSGMNTKGILCSDLGMHKQALAWFSSSLKISPDSGEAHLNIANEYHILADIDNAYLHSCTSLALSEINLCTPLLGDHYMHLRRVCDFAKIESLDWWRVLKYMPYNVQQYYFLQYLVLVESEQECITMHSILCDWGTHQPEQIGLTVSMGKSDDKVCNLQKDLGKDVLAIGFVSGDFRDHSVARFIWPLFKYIDRSRIKLICFSTCSMTGDHWQNKFIESADLFIDVTSLSPYQMLSLIQAHKIDILFDLTGFTKGSRTRLFSLRLAPIQISWLGYPGTTGLKTMDYIFVDKFLRPVSHTCFSERFAVTAGTSICFSEMDNVPISLVCPQEKRGYITFGSLNNPYKFTRKMFKVWAAVMKEVPDSVIYFVRREYNSYYLRSNIVSAFGGEGICDNRIYFYDNRSAGRHYLDCYNEIDICMDTFPVTGGTTTVDSLWMGVPVISLEGIALHQRIGSSILRQSGLDCLVAQTVDQYINLSVQLSHDLSIRKHYRENLREHIKNSLLCDEVQFADDFSLCMKSIYKEHAS